MMFCRPVNGAAWQRRVAGCIGAALATWFAAASAVAQLPNVRLTSVFPPGGNAGGTFDVEITGVDLDEVNTLVFSHPGITAEQKQEKDEFDGSMQPAPNKFTVTIKGDVPASRYDVWCVGRYGASNPRAFLVTAAMRSEILEAEPNNKIEQANEVELGSAVSGQADNTGYDYFKLKMTKGQRVLVDCTAMRIDSRLDGTLTVFDEKGNELATDRDTNRLDPLLDFTAPADGEYFVQVRDFQYQGGPEYWYRVVFRVGPYIDYVFPPAGAPGQKGKFTIFGRNLPAGQPAGVSVKGMPLQKQEVEIDVPGNPQLAADVFVNPQDASLDADGFRMTGPQGVSNAVLVWAATAPVVVEKEPNDQPNQAQAITMPCEVNGSFARSDRDWYSFEAKKDEVYWIESFCDRLGRSADTLIVVQQVTKNDKGEEQVKQIGLADDPDPKTNIGGMVFNTSNRDASLKVTIPEDGAYRINIVDQFSTNLDDPRNVYRLSVRKLAPDFRLVIVPWSSNTTTNNQPGAATVGTIVRQGGVEALQVLAFRLNDYNGPIEVAAEGLPGGVSARSIVIGEGQVSAPLVINAQDNAAPWNGTIKVVGKATIDGQNLSREARAGVVVWATEQNKAPGYSRMSSNMPLAVSPAQKYPFSVELGDGKPLEVLAGKKLEIPVKVTRRDGFKSAINLNAVGLPQNVQLNKVTIAADKNDGKLELSAANNAPPGTYTITCSTDVEWEYARNPDSVKKFEERKKTLDEMVTKLKDEAKKAADAKAENAKDLAEKVKRAEAAAKQAADALKSATDAAKPKKLKIVDLVTPVVVTIKAPPKEEKK